MSTTYLELVQDILDIDEYFACKLYSVEVYILSGTLQKYY